jgi:glucosamine--fructose-6-phosphate aminotransferase (isomerizing)
MCGIVGYIGGKSAAPTLLEGLRRLEYRGYDSAGIVVINGGEFQFHKKKGKIDDGVAQLLAAQPLCGKIGVVIPAGLHTECLQMLIRTLILMEAAR